MANLPLPVHLLVPLLRSFRLFFGAFSFNLRRVTLYTALASLPFVDCPLSIPINCTIEDWFRIHTACCPTPAEIDARRSSSHSKFGGLEFSRCNPTQSTKLRILYTALGVKVRIHSRMGVSRPELPTFQLM